MADDFPDDPRRAREPCGYLCPACREETFGSYRPYCGNCGKKMPSKLRLQATGMVSYPWDYGSPIRDIGQIAEFLKNVGETRYWLQEYRPSFRASEIRFSETDGEHETHALSCVWTERIHLPIGRMGWRGTLRLLGNEKDGYQLIDKANHVEVCAGSILLYTVDRSLRFAW